MCAITILNTLILNTASVLVITNTLLRTCDAGAKVDEGHTDGSAEALEVTHQKPVDEPGDGKVQEAGV